MSRWAANRAAAKRKNIALDGWSLGRGKGLLIVGSQERNSVLSSKVHGLHVILVLYGANGILVAFGGRIMLRPVLADAKYDGNQCERTVISHIDCFLEQRIT